MTTREMLAATTLRHSGVVDIYQLNVPINIVGAGSVGSFTALGLAKMGATDITLWDGDRVELHNIGSQFYPLDSVGVKKVTAAQRLIESFSGIKPQIVTESWNESYRLSGLVIMAVDNMAARKGIWEACLDNSEVELVIDARMGLEELLVITVDPNLPSDQVVYEDSWYPDEEALQEKCTSKTIIYTVMFAAGEIIKRVKQYTTGKGYARHVALSIPAFASTVVAA